ncbi:LysR family transcriptional regulator [Shimia sp. R11_0]|uniref:LysR family transcriptional regulator n=1 Tax=Shimia sp. R11_0 TaxID=2821096 RepID=UPI001ADA35B0|nr:LysR family transcriptional regulator [Shimia sp. R11_0]MBO9477588.1 LysR family transcriptional regulator [Shimia sp. R11_0]
MLNETALAAFFHLAEANSFQEAARRMGVSNASLSRYIAQAEAQSGLVLFHRNRNNCKLTDAGQAFLPIARALREDIGRFTRDVDLLRDGKGRRLRVGCGPLTTRTVVAPVLKRVVEEIPELAFYLDVNARVAPLEGLLSGDIDIFIGDLTHTPEAENVDILMMEKRSVMFVATPDHPIHDLGACSIADVVSYPLASGHLHRHWRNTFIKLLGGDQDAQDKVNALPQIESDDYSFLIDMALTGRYVLGAMEETFAEFVAAERLKVIEMHTPVIWNICAVKKSGTSSVGVQAFWDHLRAFGVNPVAA